MRPGMTFLGAVSMDVDPFKEKGYDFGVVYLGLGMGYNAYLKLAEAVQVQT